MNIRLFVSVICFVAFASLVQSADMNSVTNVTSSTNVATLNTTNIVNTVSVTNIVTMTNVVEKAVEKTNEKPIAAIFVINNLAENDLKYVFENENPKTLDDQTDIFRNILSSRLGGSGFGIVNQDVALAALKKAKVGEDKDLYSKLQEKNTALQLADLMGADYLIVARLLGLEYEENHFEKGKIQTDMMTYTLYTGYEVINGNDGASFISGTYEAQKKERITANRDGEGFVKKFSNNRLLKLYSDASKEIKDEFTKTLAKMKEVPGAFGKERYGYLKVECVLANLSDLPLTLPLFWVNDDGSIGVPEKGPEDLQVYIDGVEIEVDGVLSGTAGDVLDGKVGTHQLTVSRAGMKPVEKRVNFKKGTKPDKPQVYRIALQPTEEEMLALKQNILFYQDLLERNKKLDGKLRLTEAEARDIESHGQMLAQSGYRVNYDEHVKSEFKGKSPFDGGDIKLNQVLEDGIKVH